MGFYESIFQACDQAMRSFLSDTVSNVAAEVGPLAHQMVILYVFLWGFAAFRGLIQEYITDGIVRIVKLFLVVTLATNIGLYNELIANNMLALPDYLGSLLGGTGNLVGESKNTLDQILSDGMTAGGVFWEKGSIGLDTELGPYVMAALTWASVLIATAYAAFLLILSKFAMTVLVGLGPLVLVFMMFQSTSKFFESWLQQLINYSLVSALAVGVVKIIFTVVAGTAEATAAASTAAAASPEGIGIQTIATLVLLAAIGLLVLMQVTGVASALAGGIAISTMGAMGKAVGGTAETLNKRHVGLQRSYTGLLAQKAKESAQMPVKAVAAWATRKGPNVVKNAA